MTTLDLLLMFHFRECVWIAFCGVMLLGAAVELISRKAR